jgi:hypothetical protein
MGKFVGLDVSLKEPSVCILDQTGSRIFEGKVASEPGAAASFAPNGRPSVWLQSRRPGFRRKCLYCSVGRGLGLWHRISTRRHSAGRRCLRCRHQPRYPSLPERLSLPASRRTRAQSHHHVRLRVARPGANGAGPECPRPSCRGDAGHEIAGGWIDHAPGGGNVGATSG